MDQQNKDGVQRRTAEVPGGGCVRTKWRVPPAHTQQAKKKGAQERQRKTASRRPSHTNGKEMQTWKGSAAYTHTHTHSDKDVPKRPKTNKQTKEKKTQPIKRKQRRTMKTTIASIAEWGDETSRDLHACTCMRARMGERSLEEICKLFADRISPLRLKEKKTHTQGRRKVRWG